MKKRICALLCALLLLTVCLSLAVCAIEIPVPPKDRIGDLETGEVEKDFYHREITGKKKPETAEGETLAPETDPVPHPVDPEKEILLPTAYVTLFSAAIVITVLLVRKAKEK